MQFSYYMQKRKEYLTQCTHNSTYCFSIIGNVEHLTEQTHEVYCMNEFVVSKLNIHTRH